MEATTAITTIVIVEFANNAFPATDVELGAKLGELVIVAFT